MIMVKAIRQRKYFLELNQLLLKEICYSWRIKSITEDCLFRAIMENTDHTNDVACDKVQFAVMTWKSQSSAACGHSGFRTSVHTLTRLLFPFIEVIIRIIWKNIL